MLPQKTKKIRKITKEKKNIQPIQTISKYFNPHDSYQVSDIFIDQNALKNPSSESMFSVFFAFNRIIRAIQKDSYIEFQLRSHTSPINPNYVIERFKSFNNTYFFEMAQALESLIQLQKICVNRQLISIDKILQKIKDKPFFMSCCHFDSQTSVSFNRSYVSNSLIKLLGFQQEEIQLQGVKYGIMLGGYIENGGYKEAILPFIWAHINFYKTLIEFDRVQQLSKVQMANFRTKQNMLLQTKCKFIIPSPQSKIIQIEQILRSKSIFEDNLELKARMKEQIQQQQYQVLQYLIKISKNKLKGNKRLICGVKEIQMNKFQ